MHTIREDWGKKHGRECIQLHTFRNFVMNGINQFVEKLRTADIVALDSMCFIYHFENHPQYSKLTQKLFELIEEGEIQGVTSVITVAEVFSNERVIADTKLAREYLTIFESWPGLTIVESTIDVAVEAGSIRNTYALRLPDAFQIAAGIVTNADLFITNDSHYSKVINPTVMQLDMFCG